MLKKRGTSWGYFPMEARGCHRLDHEEQGCFVTGRLVKLVWLEPWKFLFFKVLSAWVRMDLYAL